MTKLNHDLLNIRKQEFVKNTDSVKCHRRVTHLHSWNSGDLIWASIDAKFDLEELKNGVAWWCTCSGSNLCCGKKCRN